MAIQSRRGNISNFDKGKMLPGEWGIALDSQEAFICFGAGITKKMATYEDYSDMMEECETATENAEQATVNANTAVADFKGLVVSKLAINDAVKSTTSGWSSNKIATELDTAKSTLNTSLANQIGTIQGTNISIPNSFNGGLLLKELQGKTVATGTPTPETPITFASVGDSGSVVAKVDNKNLYTRFTNMTQGGVTLSVSEDGTVTLNGTSNNPLHFGVPFVGHLPAGTYTLSANNPQLSNIVHVKLSSNASGGIYQNAYLELNAANKTKAFILSAGAPSVAHIYVAPGTVLNNFIIKPQLELGSIATTYEPYKEQLVTIPLAQPLRSVGSVYDRIIKKDGLWRIERHNTQEIIQNGVQLAWINTALIGTTSIQFTVSIAYRGRVNSTVITNRFESTGSVTDAGGNVFFKTISNSVFGILTTDNESAIRNKIITWFASNPTVLIYPLKTPVYETLPQAIQDALNKLQSYPGVTNMFTTDTQQPVIVVSYGKTDSSALALYASNANDSKLDTSKIANNFITTEKGFVAGAETVKILKDDIDKVNNSLDTKICSSAKLINASITTVNYSYLAKKAGVIQLALDIAFSLTNAATADFQTIFTIPEEFRPSNTVIYQRNKGTATFDIRVNAITGDVGVFTQYYTDINTIRDTVFYIGK